MEIGVLFFLAVGLSMDAFAVSVTNGICVTNIKKRQACLVAGFFGFFQGLMPLIGYLAGQAFSGYVSDFANWIAFVLLAIIGFKMIYEAISHKEEEEVCKLLNTKELFVQSVATSIDALAVGVSFSFLKVNIWGSVAFIAVITFVISFIGVIIGKGAGKLLKEKAEIAGGIVLIIIGFKILIDGLIS